MAREISSTKRLAKNTMMMYVRMGITMISSLITARILLQALGIEDYGLYDAVSGIVVLMTFLNNALNLTSQRFFSYTLGENETVQMQDLFNATIVIYLVLAGLILLLGETIGLWFLLNKMVFPEGKAALALFVYQFSLLITSFNVLRTPFSALIIADEKLNFFAMSAIVESGIHLAFVFLLLVVPVNPSYIYIVFQTTLAVFMLGFFYFYFKKHYSSMIKLQKVKDKSIYKELVSFSGWGVFGSIAVIGFQQGINILLNLFFGVTVNAAFGVANRINAMVNQFFTGFQTAANPQITKAHAAGDTNEQLKLINNTSKISFFLLMFVGIVIIYNLDYLLLIWLKNVPEHTSTLCRLMIIGAMIDALSAPLYVTVFATGKIKYYQIVISIVLLMNIFLSYIAFHLGAAVKICMYIRILLFVVAYWVRLYFVKKYTNINIWCIVREVILRVIMISAIMVFIMWCLGMIKPPLIRLLVISPILMIVMLFIMYGFGFNKNERKVLLNKAKQIIRMKLVS